MLQAVLLLQTLLLFYLLHLLLRKTEKRKPTTDLTAALEETGRNILRDLESRIERLQMLIQQADARVQALSELQASLVLEKWQDKTTEKKEEKSKSEVAGFAVPPQYSKAYDLLKGGKSIEQVAKETKIAKGEIQLILDLTESRRPKEQRQEKSE